MISPAVPEDLTEAHAPVQIESPVQSLPERKKRMPKWAVALLVLVLLGAVGGAAWYTYQQEYWGGRTVPQVVGLSEKDARTALEAAGFTVEAFLPAGGRRLWQRDCLQPHRRRAR